MQPMKCKHISIFTDQLSDDFSNLAACKIHPNHFSEIMISITITRYLADTLFACMHHLHRYN